MPKLSAAALKTRIAQLQKQLTAAQRNKAPAIKKVKALMKKLGVTVADLTGGEAPAKGRPGRRSGKIVKGKKGKRRGKVAIKYRDGQGNTWSGRGKTPRWLAAAEKAGSKRDQFLIKK
ncbi:MAG: H-NS histone family protein [Gammaproteobacteria bacterium]|nr:H-NS histone family protein [Gammaproteobacteria bacterium]